MKIRKAEERDVDAMARLAAVKREEYETYQPVFHKRAKDATETHLGISLENSRTRPLLI